MDVNIVSSLAEAERRIQKLKETKAALISRKEAKIVEYDTKIAAYKEKMENEKASKIVPIDEEVKKINQEITRCEKVRDISAKYEEQLKKFLGVEQQESADNEG